MDILKKIAQELDIKLWQVEATVKLIDEGKVMALYKAKWSQKKIADEMGCSQARISQIIRVHKG